MMKNPHSIRKEICKSEQAQSASRLESVPLLTGFASRQSELSGARSRERRAQTTIVVTQTAHSRKHLAELKGEVRENDAISAFATCAPAPAHPGDTGPRNTLEIDYVYAPDEQLLTAARSADKEAFAELSGRYVEMIHRKILAIVRNREDAEDIVQEALFKAYTHLDGFRGSSTFSTWLTRIAINYALMLLRSRRSGYEVSLDQSGDDNQAWAVWEISDPRPDAEQICARTQTSELLSYALSRLPPRSRSILEQYHAHEQSLKQAANSLGITVAAAKSRLMRARRVTRSILERKRLSLANASY